MHKYEPQKLSIKQWAESDRPREKWLNQGRKRLSNAELMAILLGSGTRDISALGLAKQLLENFDQDLRLLAKADVAKLRSFNGIGPAKAITLLAAMELGQRRIETSLRERPCIRSSKDAYEVLYGQLSDLPHEEFWVLHLNRANRVLSREQISVGGVAGTVVDTKIVFRKALQQLSCALILAHNHPSGNLQPSQADLDLTKKLKAAGKILDIQILDHLILTETAYLSFADEQLL